MAIGRQSPKLSHPLRTKAVPQHQMRSSTQKHLKLTKSASKPTTPQHQMRSSTQKILKLTKSASKPTTAAQAPSSFLNYSSAGASSSASVQQQHNHQPTPKHASQPPKYPSQPSTQSSPLNLMIRSSIAQQGSTFIEQESPSQAGSPSSADNITNTSGAEIRKKVRGKTRCLEYSKKKRASVPIDIDIPKHVKRAVGANCQNYITGMGCFVRNNVPLQNKKWSDIKREDVALLISHVREKFKLSQESHVDEAIETHMIKYYGTYRYNLYQEFKKYGSLEEAMENPPDDVEEDDWIYLIENLWTDEKWLETSAKNKRNKDKLKIAHCAGTKAFSRIRTENRNPETGEEFGRIDLFKLTRYSEKKSAWVGDTAKNAYEEMKNLQLEPPMNENSGEMMSEDEIYDQVLTKLVGPPRSSYIRGLGSGPKPKRSKIATNDAQVKEANERADQAHKQAMHLADELVAVKSIAAQQNEKLEMVEASAAQQTEELEAMKAKVNQQNEELETLKARQSYTDTIVLQLLAQLQSSK